MAEGRRLLHAIAYAGSDLPAGVEAVRSGGLQAVCSLPAPGLEDADPERVAAEARHHHAVVQRLFSSGPVLPIRFGTMMDPDDIVPLLESYGGEVAAELQRLQGLAEWGVKVIADPAALARAAEESSEAIRETDEALSASQAGRAYLLKRRREALLAEELDRHSAAVIDQVRAALARASVEQADLPPPSVTPAGGDMLANLAFLVPEQRAAEFEASADAAADSAGVELEISGPWPPYTFVRLSLGGEPA